MTTIDAGIETIPAERAFNAHIAGTGFQHGLDAGHWCIETLGFPTAVVRVFVAAGEIALQFELSDYPSSPPTACPWNPDTGSPLDTNYWPTGSRASQVFSKNWSPQNGGALYMPYDRRALAGHGNWARDNAGYIWDASKSIVDYLMLVRQILRSAVIPERPR